MFQVVCNKVKGKPPRKGQPLYKGQMSRPQRVPSLEVSVYFAIRCIHIALLMLILCVDPVYIE